jgi:hypothetical protein
LYDLYGCCLVRVWQLLWFLSWPIASLVVEILMSFWWVLVEMWSSPVKRWRVWELLLDCCYLDFRAVCWYCQVFEVWDMCVPQVPHCVEGSL